MNNNWIHVSEKLPTEKDSVTENKYDPLYMKFLCTTQIVSRDERVLLYSNNWGWLYENEDYNKYVIAWQPLPQPYKEGNNG